MITKVIDDSDYYLVILAGRYGSIGPEGISYTEMEYRYALQTGKPIIGFLHKDKNQLPSGRCEADAESRQKFSEFEHLVKKKLCRFWETAADLGIQVSRSVIRLIKDSPATGWVRANAVSASAAQEILGLKRKIEVLENQLAKSKVTAPDGAAGLAQGSDLFTFRFNFWASSQAGRLYYDDHEYAADAESSISWNALFSFISPYLIDEISDGKLKEMINLSFTRRVKDELATQQNFNGMEIDNIDIDDADFQTIKVQLRALGLMMQSEKNRRSQDKGTFWTLTPWGENVMTTLRALKR